MNKLSQIIFLCVVSVCLILVVLDFLAKQI